MTVAVFLAIQFGANTITGLAAEAIAGIASLVAVAIVTTMVLWMKNAAAGLSGELRSEMARALETGSLAVTLLAFLAVGREGVETALFMVGYAEAETAWPLVGLIIGVLAAAAIAYGMYAGAVRINLSKFFTYTGVFLIVVAAGILSYGVGALQTVGWLPGLANKAFDITSWFNWSSWYGEIIQGIFNITPTPTVLQFVGVARLPRRRARALPAPDEGAGEVRPHICSRSLSTSSEPTRTRRPQPKGRPRESLLPPRQLDRRRRRACRCHADQLHRPRRSDDRRRRARRPRRDHGRGLRHRVRTVGRRGEPPERAHSSITNNGTKVTEFYVYGEGERVMGEVENISPGLQRKLIVQLTEPGTYQTACEPGHGRRRHPRRTSPSPATPCRSTPRASSRRPPTATSAT